MILITVELIQAIIHYFVGISRGMTLEELQDKRSQKAEQRGFFLTKELFLSESNIDLLYTTQSCGERREWGTAFGTICEE